MPPNPNERMGESGQEEPSFQAQRDALADEVESARESDSGTFDQVFENITDMIEELTDTINALVVNSGITEFVDRISQMIDDAFSDSDSEFERYNSSYEMPEHQESRPLGELVQEGPASLSNIMRIPSSAPEFDQSNATPNRWYETPRGVYWYDGEVLIRDRNVRFLIRDGYRPSEGSIENYLANRMVVFTFPGGETVNVHPQYHARLTNAWNELAAAGINYNVRRAGGFNYRAARGGGIARPYPYMSNHALGLSIDFNSDHNDWEDGITPDYSIQFMRIMARHGLRPPIIWGRHGHDHSHAGHSHSIEEINADWMHFDAPVNENGEFQDNYTNELETALAEIDTYTV